MALGFYVGLDSFSLLASSHNVRRKGLRLHEVGNAEGKGLSRALSEMLSIQNFASWANGMGLTVSATPMMSFPSKADGIAAD